MIFFTFILPMHTKKGCPPESLQPFVHKLNFQIKCPVM
jgi:hypothetical protein